MSERYEREIDDILRRMDFKPPRRPSRRPLSSRLFALAVPLAGLWRGLRRRSLVEQLMILSIILWLGSYPLGWLLPGSFLVRWMSMIGLFCFIAALVLSFTGRGRYGAQEKRWRGRIVDYHPRNFDLGWELRRLWRRVRGR